MQLFGAQLTLTCAKAAEMTSAFTPEQKIEWATGQRKEGNRLFANGEYQEAMDIYLTCLVAIDAPHSLTNPESTSSQCESEIKLPVLLNLALCALKLGMLSKAEKFCNYAIELESGQQSAKSYFRRGKVRMLQGNYISAELDLDRALDLLESSDVFDAESSRDIEKDIRVILREKQKLQELVKQAEKNQKQQKKAMQRLFESASHNQDAEPVSTVDPAIDIQTNEYEKYISLYPEKKAGTRKYSALRDDPTWDHSVYHNEIQGDEAPYSLNHYLEWYLQMIGRCSQKLLDMIGSEEDDLETSTASFSILNSVDEKNCKVD
jgi:tetratricopeptide (TPR) repeat protein